MGEGQASDSTDVQSERSRPRASSVTPTAAGTDWGHNRRGVPADEVDGIPDDATTWVCLERTDEDDVPTTLTIYNASGDGGYTVVAVDDELEELAEYNSVAAAVVGARDLLGEYEATE